MILEIKSIDSTGITWNKESFVEQEKKLVGKYTARNIALEKLGEKGKKTLRLDNST